MTTPLRVLCFESRKRDEMRSLIERHDGVATIAPAMKEIPIGVTDEIRGFLEALRARSIDLMIFLTGVGAEALLAAVETEMDRELFLQEIDRLKIVVRGPKPTVAIRKWGLHIDARADEPNTWNEVLKCVLDVTRPDSGIETAQVDDAARLAGWSIAVQEYGQPSEALYDELRRRGADVRPVAVYRWSLPDDTGPIEEAVRATVRGDFDVLLITTAQHIVHVLQIAESLNLRDEWLQAASNCFIASIGPTASERIRDVGLPVHFEPSHPHMGHLVREGLAAARKAISPIEPSLEV